jgi:hypothetical protein
MYAFLPTALRLTNAMLQDSCAKILDMLQGKPDLVIGNYTDGNLVASLVSRKLGVTQVNKFDKFINAKPPPSGTSQI